MTEEKKQTAIVKPQIQTAIEIQAEFYAKTLEIWKDESAIHEMFAGELSKVEFKYFVSLGVLFGANPFAGEIWAVKYDKSKPASIFLGRNFKRRKAQELEEYDGHYALAVYSGDTFKVVDGVPHHEYKNGDRGTLERAYCVVYKKGITRPFYKEVKFNEYNKGFSTWKQMPETMIVKVAENQGLDLAFQGVFQGTRDESEQWKEDNPENVKIDPKMEVSTETVRGHDDTGIEDKKLSPGAQLAVEHNDKYEASQKTEEEDPETMETTEEMAKRIEREVKEKVHKEETDKIAQDKIAKDAPTDSDAPPITDKEKRDRKFNVASLLRVQVGNDPNKQQTWLKETCAKLFDEPEVTTWTDVKHEWLDEIEAEISELAKP